MEVHLPNMNPRVYINISIDGQPVAERLVFQLFADKTPIACNNFLNLCRGIGVNGSDGNPLSFKGCELKPISQTEGVTFGVTGAGSLDKEISDLPFLDSCLCATLTEDGERVDGSRFVIYAKEPPATTVPDQLVIGWIFRGSDVLTESLSGEGEPKKMIVVECGVDEFYEQQQKERSKIIRHLLVLQELVDYDKLMDRVDMENYDIQKQYQEFVGMSCREFHEMSNGGEGFFPCLRVPSKEERTAFVKSRMATLEGYEFEEGLGSSTQSVTASDDPSETSQ